MTGHDEADGARPDVIAAADRLIHQLEQLGPVACQTTDPDQWFPNNGMPTEQILSLCERCPVNAACLDYALLADERYGIWGGTTPTQRTSLRKDQT